MGLDKEKHIQQQCINFLIANGWYVTRLNSGRIRSSYTHKKGRLKGTTTTRSIRLVDEGTPDIMAHKFAGKIGACALLIYVEVKQPGEKPSDVQLRKMTELSDFGAVCFVAHSYEELEEDLKNYYE